MRNASPVLVVVESALTRIETARHDALVDIVSHPLVRQHRASVRSSLRAEPIPSHPPVFVTFGSPNEATGNDFRTPWAPLPRAVASTPRRGEAPRPLRLHRRGRIARLRRLPQGRTEGRPRVPRCRGSRTVPPSSAALSTTRFQPPPAPTPPAERSRLCPWVDVSVAPFPSRTAQAERELSLALVTFGSSGAPQSDRHGGWVADRIARRCRRCMRR